MSTNQFPKVVSFHSFAGGVGKTSIIYALASHFAENTDKKVLVMEFNLFSPTWLYLLKNDYLKTQDCKTFFRDKNVLRLFQTDCQDTPFRRTLLDDSYSDTPTEFLDNISLKKISDFLDIRFIQYKTKSNKYFFLSIVPCIYKVDLVDLLRDLICIDNRRKFEEKFILFLKSIKKLGIDLVLIDNSPDFLFLQDKILLICYKNNFLSLIVSTLNDHDIFNFILTLRSMKFNLKNCQQNMWWIFNKVTPSITNSVNYDYIKNMIIKNEKYHFINNSPSIPDKILPSQKEKYDFFGNFEIPPNVFAIPYINEIATSNNFKNSEKLARYLKPLIQFL